MIYFIIALLSYGLGSLPFGYFIGKYVYKKISDPWDQAI